MTTNGDQVSLWEGEDMLELGRGYFLQLCGHTLSEWVDYMVFELSLNEVIK